MMIQPACYYTFTVGGAYVFAGNEQTSYYKMQRLLKQQHFGFAFIRQWSISNT